MNSNTTLLLLKRLFIVGVILITAYFVLIARKEMPGLGAKKEKREKVDPKALGKNTGAKEPDSGGGKHADKKPSTKGKSLAWQKTGSVPMDAGEPRQITVVHLHLPEDPASQALARDIEEVRSVYSEQVTVTTLDVAAHPEKIADWSMTSAPSLVIQTEEERLFTLQESWPTQKLQERIVQLIYGLRSAGKDWRPDVKGMERR